MKRWEEIKLPEDGPEISWEEEIVPRPYKIGDSYDPEKPDKEKDITLCPICGEKKKGKPDLTKELGEMRFACRNGHTWIFNSKSLRVEGLNRRLEFPEK